jgi:AmiR/NasT family two-component response regulator
MECYFVACTVMPNPAVPVLWIIKAAHAPERTRNRRPDLERHAGCRDSLRHLTDIDVVTFVRPLEAVRYAAENPLDLVVTDFSMPELDGLGVIRQLKRMEHLFDVPIVVVTAHEGMDVRYAPSTPARPTS